MHLDLKVPLETWTDIRIFECLDCLTPLPSTVLEEFFVPERVLNGTHFLTKNP